MDGENDDYAITLLVEARLAEGSDAMVSAGSFELARMIAGNSPTIDRFTMFVGGARSVERMLAGTLAPCQEWGEELGRLTEGALTSAMFLKPWDGVLPEQPPERADAAEGRPVEALAVIHGRLGEVPSGPLFKHMIDPTHPGTFVVTGLGMAWTFDENSGFAMRTAIAAGLMDVAAARPGARA